MGGVQSSLDNVSWQAADCQPNVGGYDTIPTTAWITRLPNADSRTVHYRVLFNLATDDVDCTLSVDVHADNVAKVFLNGTSFGAQPGTLTTPDASLVPNFRNPPETFTVPTGFLAGPNTLSFDVLNKDQKEGLDFLATVKCQTAPVATEPVATDVYAAKFLCGTRTASHSEGPAVAGTYGTSINVHNPNGGVVAFRKKAILLYRADKPPTVQTYESPKNPDPFVAVKLEANWGMEIDCDDIRGVLLKPGTPAPPGTIFIEGWVVIEVPGVAVPPPPPASRPAPLPLDVTAVYTSKAGLDIEPVIPKRVTK